MKILILFALCCVAVAQEKSPAPKLPTVTPSEERAIAQKNNWSAIAKMQFYRAQAAEMQLQANQAKDQMKLIEAQLPALKAAIDAACKKIDPKTEVDDNGECGPMPAKPEPSKSDQPKK